MTATFVHRGTSARKVPVGHFNAYFQFEDFSDFTPGGSVEERRWTGGVPRLFLQLVFAVQQRPSEENQSQVKNQTA